MEEKTEKKTIKERFNDVGRSIWSGFKKVGRFIDNNKEIIVGLLGFSGTVLGFAAVTKDHKMTREEQEHEDEMKWFEKGWIYDPENYVDWYAEMSNDEKKEMLEREKNGESRMNILEDMGKI